MKNIIMAGLSIALLVCAAILYEVNRAEYWDQQWAIGEIEQAYTMGCIERRPIVECKVNAFYYTEEIKRAYVHR